MLSAITEYSEPNLDVKIVFQLFRLAKKNQAPFQEQQNQSDQYVRVGGLYILPALGEVLPEFVERTEAKFPLQLCGVSLFG